MVDTILNIIKDILKVKDLNINEDTTFDDLGIDSLVKVELTIALEDKFHINIEPAEEAQLQSVRDVLKLVSLKLGVNDLCDLQYS